ncbi:MAG: FecR domain-containing protein [Deltaproteobacteria bacterium]|nr:FecR domain-containing protein [Deltaproteobacteria bacterium]
MKKTALLLSVMAFLLTAASLGAWAAGKSDQARITKVEGRVTVNGRRAVQGGLLKDGDWVATGKMGLCEIVFADKNILRLWHETRVKISVSGKRKTLELIRGTLSALARGLNRYGNKRQFALSVNTPTAVCGVRGTAFCVRVKDSMNSYVCLCNGKMNVAAKDGRDSVDAESAHHRAFLLTAHADSVSITPAGMEYHTDADLESLAGAISEKMDWTKVED